ncbi:MAG: TlpA disulfide reductase family protein [Pseudomonadota bacterium]
MNALAWQLRLLIGILMLACSLPGWAGDETANAPDAIGPSNYVGKTLDGAEVLLSQHKGKVVVVSFWATWCPYCLKELPILNGLQKLAGKEQMYVVAVNTEERAVFRKVVRALDKMDLSFAYDPDKRAQKAYKVNGIPHMLIIDRDGNVIQTYRGYDESALDGIVAEINKALATPASKPDAQAGAAPAST